MRWSGKRASGGQIRGGGGSSKVEVIINNILFFISLLTFGYKDISLKIYNKN